MHLIIGAKSEISEEQINYAAVLLRKAKEMYPKLKDAVLDVQFSGVPKSGWSVCLYVRPDGGSSLHGFEGLDPDDVFSVDSKLDLFAH
jgi:hypothetical protein